MTHRKDDDRVRIVREVPLWGILMLVIGGLGQGAALWYGQQAQGEAIARLSARVVELTVEIRELRTELAGKNLKDGEHDIRIADHERRILMLEAAVRAK